METESSVSCPKQPATGPYPEPDGHTLPHYFINIHFNIIVPARTRSFKWVFLQILRLISVMYLSLF